MDLDGVTLNTAITVADALMKSHSVKFRNVATRGMLANMNKLPPEIPTVGAPTMATPVKYASTTEDDGIPYPVSSALAPSTDCHAITSDEAPLPELDPNERPPTAVENPGSPCDMASAPVSR